MGQEHEHQTERVQKGTQWVRNTSERQSIVQKGKQWVKNTSIRQSIVQKGTQWARNTGIRHSVVQKGTQWASFEDLCLGPMARVVAAQNNLNSITRSQRDAQNIRRTAPQFQHQIFVLSTLQSTTYLTIHFRLVQRVKNGLSHTSTPPCIFTSWSSIQHKTWHHDLSPSVTTILSDCYHV